MDTSEVGLTRSFDELYESSRDRLALQLYALTGDRAGACDLVQEAFVRCWVRWDRIGSYDDPEACVRRIAYNLAKSSWRQSWRTRLHASPPERPQPDPDDGDRQDLIAAMQQLSADQRTAVTLHHLGGLSVEDTAAQMEAPVSTVKSWLLRGRGHLATHITETRRQELSADG